MEASTITRNGFQRPGNSYNVVSNQHFRKIQVLFVFSTIVSQTEVLTTSRNSFHKTGSSYDVVPNQHFREQNSNPIHVFDFCQVKWKRLRPPKMVSRKPEVDITSFRIKNFRKLSNPIHVFD